MSPIEKGDRVRVHADGDVTHVDPAGHSGMPPRFRVTLQLHDNDVDLLRGRTRERFRDERTAWFYDDEVEPTLDEPLVKDNGWRDIAADLLRDDRVPDAVAMIQEHALWLGESFARAAGDVTGYLRALERLEEAFGNLPPLEGVFGDADVIRACQNATNAYMALGAFRKAK